MIRSPTLSPNERNTSPVFDYDEAFSRNIGWLTAAEQTLLRGKRVAIAGLGGVGGAHVLTLARLGIGAFNLADFDAFALPNFNRQAGAVVSTLGRAKTDVIAEMARRHQSWAGSEVLCVRRVGGQSGRVFRGC